VLVDAINAINERQTGKLVEAVACSPNGIFEEDEDE
jgi:hypothetical protein